MEPSFFEKSEPLRFGNVRGISRLVGLGALTAGWVGIAAAHQAFVPEDEKTRVFQYWLRYWARSLVTSSTLR